MYSNLAPDYIALSSDTSTSVHQMAEDHQIISKVCYSHKLSLEEQGCLSLASKDSQVHFQKVESDSRQYHLQILSSKNQSQLLESGNDLK